jgi:hypothetical protein
MSYLPVKRGSALLLWQHGQPQGYQQGLGAYQRVGDWTWEFDGPEAYAFLNPLDSAPQPAPILSGLGGCGCGGTCGGCGDGHSHGMGQATGGVLGTGLFSSTDISTWGWGEWVAVAGAVYLGGSLIGDIGGAASSVSGWRKSSTRAAKRRAQAQADMF